jgi:hypothetical protein
VRSVRSARSWSSESASTYGLRILTARCRTGLFDRSSSPRRCGRPSRR